MNPLRLEEWELWYTFSTYFTDISVDLETAGKLFVKAGIAECCITSSGQTFCKSENGFVSGSTELELSGDLKSMTAKFRPEAKELPEMNPFAHEALLIGIQFLFGESRQFSQGRDFPPHHLRAFLQPICLVNGIDEFTFLYPVVVLYQSGALLIEFRVISPNHSMEINDFVEKYVNIHQCEYDFAMVSSGIGVLAPEAYQFYTTPKVNILQRLEILQKKRQLILDIQSRSQQVKLGEFEFSFVPLSRAEKKESLTSIAHTLQAVIGLALREPITTFGLLIKGIPTLPRIGSFWIGRPHIHVLRHSNQMETSSANEEANMNAFRQILARVTKVNCDTSIGLPPNSRKFQDYAAYITHASSLWVWSKSGLETQKAIKDVNRGNFVYEHQVQVELLEYGFILNKSLAEKSQSLKAFSDILLLRKELASLKLGILEASPYGEVNDLLCNGWDQMNVEAMQNQIAENLAILESEIKYNESRRAGEIRIWFTLIGLATSAKFALSVVGPTWKALGLWLPSNENLSEPFLMVISFVILVSILQLIRRLA
jgi:hypothetical protein